MNPTICKWASVLIAIYRALVELGRSNSYFSAIGLASWFYIVWWLGTNNKAMEIDAKIKEDRA